MNTSVSWCCLCLSDRGAGRAAVPCSRRVDPAAFSLLIPVAPAPLLETRRVEEEGRAPFASAV